MPGVSGLVIGDFFVGLQNKQADGGYQYSPMRAFGERSGVSIEQKQLQKYYPKRKKNI